MATFKEFLSTSTTNALASLESHKKEVESNSTEILLASARGEEKISSGEARKFSNELSNLVHSERFIDQLSEKLPDPKVASSKAEYVASAKAEMRALLKKNMTK